MPGIKEKRFYGKFEGAELKKIPPGKNFAIFFYKTFAIFFAILKFRGGGLAKRTHFREKKRRPLKKVPPLIKNIPVLKKYPTPHPSAFGWLRPLDLFYLTYVMVIHIRIS